MFYLDWAHASGGEEFLHGQDVCVHELVTGASCGFWWVGEKDWEGIPSALMQCGTPRNYFCF